MKKKALNCKTFAHLPLFSVFFFFFLHGFWLDRKDVKTKHNAFLGCWGMIFFSNLVMDFTTALRNIGMFPWCLPRAWWGFCLVGSSSVYPLATSLVNHHPRSASLLVSPSFCFLFPPFFPLCCSVPISSSLTFQPGGWSHPLNQAIGHLCHFLEAWLVVASACNKIKQVFRFRLSGKWVKEECRCQAATSADKPIHNKTML